MKQLVIALGITLCACSSDDEAPPNGGNAGGGGTAGTNAGVAGSSTTAGTGSSAAGASGSGSGSGGGGQGGSVGTAGTAGTGGGSAGSSGAGTSGSSTGGGGMGGMPPGGFSCPSGSESLTPTLPSSVPEGTSPPGAGANNNLEGPVWIGGALYVSEFPLSSVPMTRIFRYTPGTGFGQTPFIADAGTNGLAVDNQGKLIGALHKDGSVSRFDIANPTAAPTKLAFEYATDGASGEKKRFNSPNDIAVHSNGTIYFTDPDWQAPDPKPQGAERVYRIRDGAVQHLLGVTVTKPNGILLTRDESTLYIGGTNGLFKYPVNPDGSVGTEQKVNVNEIGGVDGVTKDCAGHLYITTGSKVVVLRPNDMLLGEISGITGVTNVAFGGADHRTLFITSMQPPRLREITLNVPGYPY